MPNQRTQKRIVCVRSHIHLGSFVGFYRVTTDPINRGFCRRGKLEVSWNEGHEQCGKADHAVVTLWQNYLAIGSVSVTLFDLCRIPQLHFHLTISSCFEFWELNLINQIWLWKIRNQIGHPVHPRAISQPLPSVSAWQNDSFPIPSGHDLSWV